MPPPTAVARIAAAAPPEASKVLKTSTPSTALLPLSSRSRATLPAPRHPTARQKAATTQAAATANRIPSSTPVAVAAAIATPSTSGSALRAQPGGPDLPPKPGGPLGRCSVPSERRPGGAGPSDRGGEGPASEGDRDRPAPEGDPDPPDPEGDPDRPDPVGGAVGDDAVGGDLADTGECVELLGGGGVEVEQRGRGGAEAARGHGGVGRGCGVAGGGDSDLFAVGELAGEVDGVEVGAGGGATGGPDGVLDAAAGGEADETGAADPAGHVDGQLVGCGRRGGVRRGSGQGLVRWGDRFLAARRTGQAWGGPGPDEPAADQRGQGEQRDRDPLASGTGQHRAHPGTETVGRQDERRRLGHDTPSGRRSPPKNLTTSLAAWFALSTPPAARVRGRAGPRAPGRRRGPAADPPLPG